MVDANLPASSLQLLLHSAGFLLIQHKDKDPVFPGAVVFLEQLQQPLFSALRLNHFNNLNRAGVTCSVQFAGM